MSTDTRTIFTGAGVAIVTPFNPDGSINYEVLGNLIEEQIAGGTDAIITCGTTGESATMSDEEHKEVIRFTLEKVNKRVPVIAGTGSNDTAYAIELSKHAEKLGVDGVLLVTPYYNKTSQRGLVAHFTAIADAISIPAILYNVPSRTGVSITFDTYKKLAQHKNIVGTKEASNNVALVSQIMAEIPDFDVYSGEDGIIVPIMSVGGKGVISVLSNVAPRETHEMAKACLDGDFKMAAMLQNKYIDLILSLFCDVNPIPVKEALNMMGKNVGACRLPLYEMSEENKERLAASLRAVNLL